MNDIAFVKIDGSNFPTVAMGESSGIKVGQTVIAIGNALGQYANTVTTGIVSGIGRNITAGDSMSGSSEVLNNVIQTDAAINSGNSGGPLVDISGQVIGMNTAVADAENVGFAIPIDAVKKQLESVKTTGKIVNPYIGVRYVQITDDFASMYKLKYDYGALVYASNGSEAVISGSPADKAGIKKGDIIIKIDGKEVNEDNSIANVLQSHNPGDKIKLTIVRDDEEMDIEVTLGSSS